MRFDVESYTEATVGVRSRSTGQRGQTELICDCPWCEGKSKLYINAASGQWTCYKCSDGGGLVKLVELLEGLNRTQAERFVRKGSYPKPAQTVAELAERVSAVSTPTTGADMELPPEFIPCYDPVVGWRMPAYLRQRVRARTAAAYRLGFCTEGRYGGRVICPVHVHGELVTFQGRAMSDAVHPKYLGPPAARAGALYGFDEAVGGEVVTVVEGPFDVMGCYQAGVPAVGLMGKEPSSAAAILLRNAGVKRVVVLLDPEARKEAHKTAAVFGEILTATVASLPPGCDPGNADPDIIRAVVSRARPSTLRSRMMPT